MTNSCDSSTPRVDSLVESFRPQINGQLEQFSDWYLDQLQSGQSPPRVEIVAAYRELADQIQRRLELIELLHGSDPQD